MPRAGSLLRNPDLARTLQAVAAVGPAGFYGGTVGAELARFSTAQGGFFTQADLSVQTARWGEPIHGTYRDVTLYETPSPTQGFTVLQMLNLLEPFKLQQQPFLGPESAHLMVQANQVAHDDRDRFLADPAFADVWMERLISKAHADIRRGQMDPARALPWDQVSAKGSLTGDTACIAVVDAQGHAVCR